MPQHNEAFQPRTLLFSEGIGVKVGVFLFNHGVPG
jgi:hypothetical protein